MSTLYKEEQLKDKDFFISQDGNFYSSDDNQTLDTLAHDLALDLRISKDHDAIDYLVNYLGFVTYEHKGNEIVIKKPNYEMYGVKMSIIQKKKLVDYVLNYEQKGSALITLTSILELDSDDCSLEMKKRGRR